MVEIANRLTTENAILYTAEVKSFLDGKYLLADAYGRVKRARKVASCVIEPGVGDVVFAANGGGDTDYLLAIVEKKRGTTTTLAMEGDVSIVAATGKLDVTAKDGVSIGTPCELELVANTLGFSGQTLIAAIKKIALYGDETEVNISEVKLFSKKVRSRIESAVQQFVNRHTRVEGVDNLAAGTIKQTARDLFNLRGRFMFMKAKKNVKIDGKQIFMG